MTTPEQTIERDYLWGQCRNDPYATAHLYEGSFNDLKGPLCIYGWNRANGFRFSILRNVVTGPRCKVCQKRADRNLGAVEPREHKTRWL